MTQYYESPEEEYLRRQQTSQLDAYTQGSREEQRAAISRLFESILSKRAINPLSRERARDVRRRAQAKYRRGPLGRQQIKYRRKTASHWFGRRDYADSKGRKIQLNNKIISGNYLYRDALIEYMDLYHEITSDDIQLIFDEYPSNIDNLTSETFQDLYI